MRLHNKVALITGGGAGIGRAGVEAFLREGAKVMVAEVNVEHSERLKAELPGFGETWAITHTDVTLEESVSNVVRATVDVFGRLDILYNNAGASSLKDGSTLTAEIDGFWDAIRLNLFGTWMMCRAGIPEIIKAGGGAVINTTSTAGMAAASQVECYSAAKAGVIAITRTMAQSFAENGVRVNALAPGRTNTERTRAAQVERDGTPGLIKSWRQNLLGMVEPSDLANAAVFLASDEAAMITGHVLPVDSGWLL